MKRLMSVLIVMGVFPTLAFAQLGIGGDGKNWELEYRSNAIGFSIGYYNTDGITAYGPKVSKYFRDKDKSVIPFVSGEARYVDFSTEIKGSGVYGAVGIGAEARLVKWAAFYVAGEFTGSRLKSGEFTETTTEPAVNVGIRIFLGGE